MNKSTILYAEDHFQTIQSKMDDAKPTGQNEMGYGIAITTRYLVRLNHRGPWRRVYCTQISNAGSIWIKVKGVKYHFRHDMNLVTSAEQGGYLIK